MTALLVVLWVALAMAVSMVFGACVRHANRPGESRFED